MRLVSFDAPGPSASPGPARRATGVLDGDRVIDLTAPSVGLPGDMASLLALGDEALERARRAVSEGADSLALGRVRLLAPVPVPPKILAIGMNYRAHVAEMGREPPEYQYWFNKQRTAVTGPGDPIVIPAVSDAVDYEGELAMVIGRRCQNVPAARALEVVAGFTVLNDVSVRDWQWRTPTFTMGKSFNTHAPMGPALVTTDEVGDPAGLSIRTWVGSELRQDSTTEDLIFSCADMIEYLTSAFPLEPGDVVATGTPSGVGAAFDPPRWLRPGDTVTIEIERVGRLENPVTHEGTPRPLGLD